MYVRETLKQLGERDKETEDSRLLSGRGGRE